MEATLLEVSFIVLFAGLLAWLTAILKQPVILGYVLCGVIVGPWGLGLVHEVELVDIVAHIGITLLLFLAGMVLHPQRLVQLFKSTTRITVLSCAGFAALGFVLLVFTGATSREALYAGLALMFSSTILVVKLLPTTALHQRHMGAFCIAVLIVQDIIAVLLLAYLGGPGDGSVVQAGLLLPLKAAALAVFAVGFEQWILRRMMRQCEKYHEVLYMLCFGWCLGVAALSAWMGLSYEIGAFVGGVAMARNPVSRFLSEQLKPIRDFFLMFFFFVLGARLNLFLARDIWLPALLLSVAILAAKPLGFWWLFKGAGEPAMFSREIAFRMGQGSEFGLILAIAAEEAGRLTEKTSQLIQLVIILTIVLSSYLVVRYYPTPLGTTRMLKQD